MTTMTVAQAVRESTAWASKPGVERFRFLAEGGHVIVGAVDWSLVELLLAQKPRVRVRPRLLLGRGGA